MAKISDKEALMENTIIYLIGNPGVGKLTIAKKIAEQKNIKLVDNHVYTNSIFSISEDFTNPKHQEYRLKVRDVVYDAMVDLCPPEQSFILTNVIYEGEESLCLPQLETVAERRGSIFVPVHLKCDMEENRRRIRNPFRKDYFKTTDPKVLDTVSTPLIMHKNLKELDITNLSPEEAANEIINHANRLQKIKSCVLCHGIKDNFVNIVDQYREYADNVTLFETPSFKVIPDKFPISKNHIIILPKEHINTFAEFNDAQGREVGHILNKLERVSRAKNFIMFEHGTSKKEEVGTPFHIKSIFHAHLHFIPDVKCDTVDMLEFFNKKGVNLIDFNDSKRNIYDFESRYQGNEKLVNFIGDNVIYENSNRSSVESYFYIKNSDNTQLFFPERLVNPQIPSQFLREALSDVCDTPEWNWKQPMSEEGRQKYGARILDMTKRFKENQAANNQMLLLVHGLRDYKKN